jgi:hypothetical protein
MMTIAEGIAHVSFAGGGMFLPARSPYDRQVLTDHVVDRVRSKGSVQVLLDTQRWLVQLLRAGRTARCEKCNSVVDCICYTSREDAACCIRCAFAARGNRLARRRSKGAPRGSRVLGSLGSAA